MSFIKKIFKKKTCLTCAYLCKYTLSKDNRSMQYEVTKEERSEFKENISGGKTHYGYECYKGIWCTGASTPAKLSVELDKKRKKSSCFYSNFVAGLRFATINELNSTKKALAD